MAINQTAKFYGGVAKRVLVLFQKDCATTYNYSYLEFIQNRFNTVRNYREFDQGSPVEIMQTTSDKLPRMKSLREGDVCLIIGVGRFIDKASYNFASKCFSHGIPVFFIRANSREYDYRVSDSMLWKSNILTQKYGNYEAHFQAPQQYFMEIPSLDDFIVTKTSPKLYALFPAMVPVR